MRASLPQRETTADRRGHDTILLRALFELAVTASSYDEDPERYDRADHTIRPEQIADVVRKLGGDPDVPLFGADDLRD